MDFIIESLSRALQMIIQLDGETLTIVFRSLAISTTSTLLTTILAIPIALILTFSNFKGKPLVLSIMNTLLSLPTVIIGLFIFSVFSRRGPLGSLELLFTWKAIVLGQMILIFPIITTLIYNSLQHFKEQVMQTCLSLGATYLQGALMLLREGRYAVIGAIITGFGRVIGEIGISMMVGGNISGATRTITTTIALETGKGRFALGMALGIILLFTSFLLNLILHLFQRKGS